MFKRIAIKLIYLTLLTTAFDAAAAEQWGLCQAWPRPMLDYPGTERGDDAPIHLSADSAESLNNEMIKLFGDVLLQRPNEQISADETIYYNSTGVFDAFGNVRYDTGELSMLSAQAHIQTETFRGKFDDAEYFIYDRHARGETVKIIQEGQDLTVLKQSSFTTCDKDNETWSIRASTVKLNHASGMGSAYNTRIRIKKVPVFYFPYMRFPITDERMTGLLAPTIGSTELGGVEYAQPIYINIHPQLDDTLTPHYYSKRGLKLRNELRYLTRFSEGELVSENIDDKVYGGKRSFYRFTHSGSHPNNWSSNILFNRASDQDYLNDFGRSLSVTSTSTLERHAQVRYDGRYQDLFMQVQDFQILDETLAPGSQPYQRMPQIKHDFSPLNRGLMQFNMSTELVRFEREQSITGNRFNINPELSLPYRRPAGYVTPKLGLFYTNYQLDEEFNTLPSEKIQRTLPVASIDGGLFFERDTRVGSTNHIATLEPRLFYLYVPYRDQSDIPLFDTSTLTFNQAQLFSENRFSGVDRIGDTNQLTFSLASRLIRSDNGRELLYGSIGKIAYLEDRQVSLSGNTLDTRHESDILLEGHYRATDNLRLSAKLQWDTEYHVLTVQDYRMQYMSDNDHIVNVIYRDQGNRLTSPDGITKQEIDISALWSLTRRWSIMGRRYHSLPDNRTLDQMFGLEYNSCCWAFRVVRRGTFVQDTSAIGPPFGDLRYSWYMQVEMKGLASLGQRVQELMAEQILGYTKL